MTPSVNRFKDSIARVVVVVRWRWGGLWWGWILGVKKREGPAAAVLIYAAAAEETTKSRSGKPSRRASVGQNGTKKIGVDLHQPPVLSSFNIIKEPGRERKTRHGTTGGIIRAL